MYKNFSNYEIFEDGRIWSKYSNKFLKPFTRKDGYQSVCLYDNEGKYHMTRLHKVIYCAVNGLWNLPRCYEIHHLDENKCNNQIGNLLLCSHQENCNHGTRNERIAKALKGKFINHPEKSKRVGAFKDDVLVMAFPSTREAHRNGYDNSSVSKCCRGKKKTHKGYEWKYLENDE